MYFAHFRAFIKFLHMQMLDYVELQKLRMLIVLLRLITLKSSLKEYISLAEKLDRKGVM